MRYQRDRSDGACTNVRSAALIVVLVVTPVVCTTPEAAIPPTGCYKRQGLDPKVDSAIEEFRDSVPKLMEKAGIKLEEIDIIELNEAFAVQALACIRELNLDMEKVNVNGGAVATGHPLGATGAFLTVKIIGEMIRRDAKKGMVTMCIGGGMGFAYLLVRP